MESTVTETITHEATPTGAVETRETTVERDEGDITESWLSAQFVAIKEGILQQLSEHRTMLQQLTEIQSQMVSRLPSNLMELLNQQQSTITSLTSQITELATRLLIPTPVAVPVPVVATEGEPVPTLENPVVAVPAEPARPKRRAV